MSKTTTNPPRVRARSGVSVFGVVDETAAPGKFLFDYDGPHAPRVFRFYAFFGQLRIPVKSVMYRRTARGWHVVVITRRPYLSPVATVAVQAVLGSDHQREKFNLRRALRLRGASAFARSRYQLLFKEKL